MVNSKNLTIVTISTILFGLLSKWLVGVPYMAWGYFDKLFIASFILWMLYSTMLYLAIKIENENLILYIYKNTFLLNKYSERSLIIKN